MPKTVTKRSEAPAIGRAMRLGYMRVSKDDQHPELQIDAMEAARCDQMYVEKVSSGKAMEDRPELVNVLRALRSGDSLVVWKLDRMARSLYELVNIADELRSRGVFIELLSPRMVFDDSPIGKAMYGVFGIFAEMERDLIRERTHAGLAAARARGRFGGRPEKIGKKELREIRALLRDPDVRVGDVAARYHVSRATLYRYLKADEDAPARR